MAVTSDRRAPLGSGRGRLDHAETDRDELRACEHPVDVMTICDYHQVMKTVGIAELKARLSAHLREVRRGRSLVVLDRDTPIARLVPFTADPGSLVVRRRLGRSSSLQRVPLPPPLRIGLDVVDILLEERQGER